MTHSCAPAHPHRLRPVYEHTPSRLPVKPAHAEIARLAYTYWEGRGRQHGSHLEDWLRAERELLSRFNRR